MQKTGWKNNLMLLVMAVLMIGIFAGIFFADNKYQQPGPYGNNGIIPITKNDISRETPLFLIDGWLLSDQNIINFPTYIGQFASLQRGDQSVPPHGRAVYQLVLRYSGEPTEGTLNFPQLHSRHKIFYDGALLSEGIGGARATIHLTEGDHLLKVETVSTRGYYSGMYHPAALGTTENVSRMVLIQCIAYGVAFFVPLALAIFTLVLWFGSKDKVVLWFGLLCCSFSGYVSYYFVRLFHFEIGDFWFWVQSAAVYGLCFCVLRLTILVSQAEDRKLAFWVQHITGGFMAVLLALALLIPQIPWIVWLHSTLTNLFYIFVFCSVVLLVSWVKTGDGWERRLTMFGCVSFGVGLLYQLLTSSINAQQFLAFNLFEPICFFWQFEWCSLVLVGLFGAMMVARNRRILAENVAFQDHLEQMVEQRTMELSNLLEERKLFFSNMAHDLKAPISAAGSFIQAIRQHDTGVDSELLRYINLVEQKQAEMMTRVQGLTDFSRIKQTEEPYQLVSVSSLLSDIEYSYKATAEVQAVHFSVEFPEVDGDLYAQPGKLEILFENLIFNGLRATPTEGKITVAAKLEGKECLFSVADTGCGIPPEDLDRIFERFFVGSANADSGSGLGLPIVKSIVEELRGEITVSSKMGEGTVFYIRFPLAE